MSTFGWKCKKTPDDVEKCSRGAFSMPKTLLEVTT